MDCHAIKKILPVYLDGEMSQEEVDLIKSHLKACSQCQAQVKLYEQTWDLCEDSETIEPRADFVSQFWTRLSQEKTRTQIVCDWIKDVITFKKPALALALSCGVLAIMFSIVTMQNLGLENETPQIAQGSQQGIVTPQESQVAVLNIAPGTEVENVEWVQESVSIALAEDRELIDNLEFFELLDMIEDYDV